VGGGEFEFENFNELCNMDKFYVLQNEILISHKMLQSHITYSYKNLPSIVRELPWQRSKPLVHEAVQ